MTGRYLQFLFATLAFPASPTSALRARSTHGSARSAYGDNSTRGAESDVAVWGDAHDTSDEETPDPPPRSPHFPNTIRNISWLAPGRNVPATGRDGGPLNPFYGDWLRRIPETQPPPRPGKRDTRAPGNPPSRFPQTLALDTADAQSPLWQRGGEACSAIGLGDLMCAGDGELRVFSLLGRSAGGDGATYLVRFPPSRGAEAENPPTRRHGGMRLLKLRRVGRVGGELDPERVRLARDEIAAGRFARGLCGAAAGGRPRAFADASLAPHGKGVAHCEPLIVHLEVENAESGRKESLFAIGIATDYRGVDLETAMRRAPEFFASMSREAAERIVSGGPGEQNTRSLTATLRQNPLFLIDCTPAHIVVAAVSRNAGGASPRMLAQAAAKRRCGSPGRPGEEGPEEGAFGAEVPSTVLEETRIDERAPRRASEANADTAEEGREKVKLGIPAADLLRNSRSAHRVLF